MNYNVDSFIDGYFATALATTNDESTPSGGAPLVRNYSVNDIADESKEKMKQDCIKFIEANLTDLEASEEEGADATLAGEYFWLTRCGHGMGYWDGEFPYAPGKALTKACHAYGDVNLYVGDDGKIYA